MSFTSFLKKVFGDKSSRDLKAIAPILESIKAVMPQIATLDNDGLRQRIADVRADIAAATKEDNEAMAQLREEVETLPFDKRQPLWDKGYMEKPLDGRRQRNHVGHDPLRRSAYRRHSPFPG